ncbi:MAG: FAD-dependent oxidoreductase [Oscillospiraceae bacterium]|nr:FAD-dependent oxidoreductase [Oscillospiraceae bacterium]
MESIWQDVTMPRFPMLAGDIKTDVLIIGGGMAGLLCAHSLGKAGVQCVVAEAADIGGGITKNTTAKITTQHGLCCHKLLSRFGPETARLYLEANQRAVERYRKLCRTIDCDFVDEDNFIYSRTDRTVLEQELAALQALGFPAELAEELPLPFPTVGAVKFPHQARFHPLKFLAAIARDLTVYEYTPVRQLVKNTALTDRGTITADKIIIATHFPFLNKHGSYFLKLYQQRSYAIALKNAPLFEGMYLDEQENGLSFRRQGDSLILGGGGHRTGKQGGNWRELERFAAEQYPEAKITHRWATQDCMSLDGIPYIGHYSARTSNLYVAAGFNKWGMTNSMAAAQILTDLILGKENLYAPVFSPSRSILRPQLAVNALETTKNLLSFSPKRCPHLGCALKWNPQEHSWDCPCHGSRFTEDGRLIDNPATGDLKK